VTAHRLTRRPLRTALALAALAAVGVTGCSSTPSAKRVALDMVETLDISDSAKACMTEKVEAYPEDELEQIAELADSGDQQGIADLTAFSDDLATCVRAG
jgi:hypothetical protein